ESMRSYWIFDFYGHANILVLDGGLAAWEKRFPGLSMQTKQLASSNYVVGINPDILATKFRTFMALKNPDYVIVDARSEKQYDGVESLTGRKGHIPNAINLPWHELINNRDEADKFKRISKVSTLYNTEKIRHVLDIIPNDKKIILYCNAGQESSVIYFSLKELGVKSAVYDGSWFEWSEDSQMPVEN
ncbi:MAG: sulfurtransferase, partial [Gammaproteobacteria bacterium]|nr:sulfurtransferase [Gammaproteobacteria bacterium]